MKHTHTALVCRNSTAQAPSTADAMYLCFRLACRHNYVVFQSSICSEPVSVLYGVILECCTHDSSGNSNLSRSHAGSIEFQRNGHTVLAELQHSNISCREGWKISQGGA